MARRPTIPRKATPALTRLRIERLYWRAGFGATPRELKRLVPLGLAAAVDELLAPPRGTILEAGPTPSFEGKSLDPENEWSHDVLWWLDRAVRARHQLVERMTLNLHDHFATSNEKVGDVKLMMAQYRTLRKHSLGSFRELSHAMLEDHALQQFLDLIGSNQESPNENFAREFFELFTLGVNNGYTETDIREAARALTGFTFDWESKQYGFDTARHDRGVKRIFGKKGRFEPKDVVDLAIDHPRHAPYICGTLWGYFSPEPCPKDAMTRMVAAYRGSKTQLRPVVRIILTHPAFYANLDEPNQVKPPFVYVAGMLRRTGRKVDSDNWGWMLSEMGQRPFYPPNVSGWEHNDAWLATNTIRSRFQAAASLISKSIEDGDVPKTQTPAQAVQDALRATGDPWISPKTRDALYAFAARSVVGKDDEWEWKHYYAERQRVLRHVLLAGPDAQVS
jgi:uncharacterized protein (DUF1800 family)